MKRALVLPLACAMALSLGLASAWASGDWPDNPKWAVRKSGYDAGGNSAMLSPSNDTRVNLALLLADRGAPGKQGARRVPLFDWETLDREIAPAAESSGETEGAGSRCQTNAGGAEAFANAVSASRGPSAAEKAALIAARKELRPNCFDANVAKPDLALASAKSPQARAFAAYLRAAADFYWGDFAAATAAFAGLAGTGDAWLRETALYMAARSELNRAQQSAFDEWGGVASPRRTDMEAAAAALGHFRAYLAAYPAGHYAASASGLIRRVHWLTGNDRELAAAYGTWLGKAAPDARGAVAQEIDHKLLFTADRAAFTDPLLLAVSDLQRMRKQDADSESEVEAIARAEIEGQRKYFAGMPELHSYLLAAEALHVRGQPREVLALIPDAARQQRFSYVQFSRQMLRGFALEAVGDRNARGFWLEMFGGAKEPWQREALELAYAMHEERSSGLARVFAANSPVRNPAIREILLEFTAGPDLLRQQARDKAAANREREAALYVLLAKQLGHGDYAGFLADVKLVPASAPGDHGDFSGAQNWSSFEWSQEQADETPVPLGVFAGRGQLGDYGCPALAETVARLARTPAAPTPRLCLAEFWRASGFDFFAFDTPLAPDELGGTKSLFPGQPYARQAVYQSVMADRAASADEKAYALYRAVRCYAPSGNNDCGGASVPVGQRRAWFQRLKREFPQSRWARQLGLYW